MSVRDSTLYCVLGVFLLGGCASTVPGGTSADAGLQRDIIENISFHEQFLVNPGCRRFTVADTQIVERRADRSVVSERWVIDRCGKLAAYRVNLTPGPEGRILVRAALE